MWPKTKNDNNQRREREAIVRKLNPNGATPSLAVNSPAGQTHPTN
jgi:hypothetical protein